MRPLVEKVLYILGPSLVGFAGYWAARRYVALYLIHSPAVRKLSRTPPSGCVKSNVRADLRQLELAPLGWRLLQLMVPVVCIVAYLFWTGSGVHKQAIRELILPVTTNAWLLILPYALMVPVLLTREHVRKRMLRKLFARADAGRSPTTS